MYCPKCKEMTKHVHEHDAAHGIPGTHMSGSERYRCSECDYWMGKTEGEKQGLKFELD